MHISKFDYALPEHLVAQQPLSERDASRMLVLDRAKRSWIDSQFRALPEYLFPGDLLVLNNTRVFPARLIGRRDPSGGRVEVLLVREIESQVWQALVRPAHRLQPGARLWFGDSQLRAEVLAVTSTGLRVLRFAGDGPLDSVLDEIGQTPLPPYIKRPAGSTQEDRERYQTIFARERGAIAAPTAGLHFSKRMMDQLRASGVRIAEITLHVGYGTFEPVRVDQIEAHRVEREPFEIRDDATVAINETRSNRGRIIAVGTTTTRALESAVNAKGKVGAGAGAAELTITPGYKFRVVDAMITNFHLPRSSLLLLVSAFAGRDLVLAAYRHAVEARYRFYSYGDCMLII
jgi:S-adenosylmethionine:tRNA ribosyltransferase-isomerase